MANTKSAQKRIRSNERKRMRNQMYRSRVKTLIRKAEQSIFGGQPSDEAIREAISGVICRCTGYQQIVDAIRAAAQSRQTMLRGGAEAP